MKHYKIMSKSMKTPSELFETPKTSGFDQVQPIDTHEEALVEQLFHYYDDIDCAVTVDQRITAKEQAELWLKRILADTQDNTRHMVLQDIMDEVSILHKKKELDDNGFCTMRDLLNGKALTDK